MQYNNTNLPQQSELYKVLGVSPDVSPEELRKVYLKLAMKYHPDKNPNASQQEQEEFKKMTAAYEILSDPERRQIYNRYGMEGLSGVGAGAPTNVLKATPKRINISLTLQEVYNGTTKNIKNNRTQKCDFCDGKGSSDDNIEVCKDCSGMGVVTIQRPIGPMMQVLQTECNKCSGKGKVFKSPDKICMKCFGKRLIIKEDTISVTIERGIPDKHTLVIANQGDDITHPKANVETGDLHIVINYEPHPEFTVGQNGELHITKTITLFESLTRAEFVLTHLDGRHIDIHTQGIVKHGDKKMVINEGMFFFKKGPFNRGNLVITFLVEYPSRFSEEQTRVLSAILPHPTNSRTETINKDIVEMCTLTDYVASVPEQPLPQPQNVQCSQQ